MTAVLSNSEVTTTRVHSKWVYKSKLRIRWQCKTQTQFHSTSHVTACHIQTENMVSFWL